MSDAAKNNGSSLEQKKQSQGNKANADASNKTQGIDKRLNGPNRPSI